MACPKENHGSAQTRERFKLQPIGWPVLQVMQCNECARLFIAIEARPVCEVTTQQIWNQLAILTVAQTQPGDAPEVGGTDDSKEA